MTGDPTQKASADESVAEISGHLDEGRIFGIGDFDSDVDAADLMVDCGAFTSVCPSGSPRMSR